MLIDAHAHLDPYPDDILPSLLEEIASHRILTISTAMDVPSCDRARSIAAKSALVLPKFGIHPSRALAYGDRLPEVSRMIEQSPMLGTIGPDYRSVDDARQRPAGADRG